jgi:hypothetical protein
MASRVGWASVTACATAAAGNTFSSYGASSSSDGCAEIDKSFTSLGAVSGPILATDLRLWATGTAPSGNTIKPVSVNFDTTGSTDTWRVVGNGTATQNSSFSYVVNANTGGSYTGGSYPSPSVGFVWAINKITLVPTGTYSNAGSGTETVTMTFCLGQATTIGCAAADSGTITATFSSSSTPTYTCLVGSAGSCVSAASDIVNGFAFTKIAVLNIISLNETYPGNQTFTLKKIKTNFGEFAESTEPSTFPLLGTGLIGVAFIRYRKLRRSRLAPELPRR